jgi:type II secretory pathway predicted ATPase ExeA
VWDLSRARPVSHEELGCEKRTFQPGEGLKMSQEYLEYWGFSRDPFHLAPDNEMMYLGGQYYECFERLLYAINTNKGGALLVSEQAGLGKSTILLKLVAEMRWNLGDNFRCAFIDHPTLTISQLMAQITSNLFFSEPHGDKLINLATMRDQLTQIKQSGGKSIIIIDEAHTLTDRPEVFQDLRMLLNLTHEKEYLLTLILSGQKPLWGAIKGIPEFWQRLPVKYYLLPLQIQETEALISHRLNAAGFDSDSGLFTPEAVEMIQRFSNGLPRTIVALCDVALLVGSSYRAPQIGYKEMTRAIHAMSGKGEYEGISATSSPRKKGDEPSFLERFMSRFKR